MDILELPKLNEKFDVIECCGVIHHMNNPSDGLGTLLKVLHPEGMMKLGLYSELARKDIVIAREIISVQRSGTRNEDIRKFRNNVLNGNYQEIKN